MCPILDGYGVTGIFLIPVHTLVWTASYGTNWRVMYAAWWLSFAEAATSNRVVHNRAAACVAAGGGIFENQL